MLKYRVTPLVNIPDVGLLSDRNLPQFSQSVMCFGLPESRESFSLIKLVPSRVVIIIYPGATHPHQYSDRLKMSSQSVDLINIFKKLPQQATMHHRFPQDRQTALADLIPPVLTSCLQRWYHPL